MENHDQENKEFLDDDIMQCRRDILNNRSRTQSGDPENQNPDSPNPNDSDDRENTLKRQDVSAERISPFTSEKNEQNKPDNTDTADNSKNSQNDQEKSSFKIPDFDQLIAADNQVVDTSWENPEKTSIQETQTPSQDTPSDEIETEIPQCNDPHPDNQENPRTIANMGMDLNPDYIVTEEEVNALHDDTQSEQSLTPEQSETDTSQGLEELKKIVAEANSQAKPQIDELDDFDDLMNSEDAQPTEEDIKTADADAQPHTEFEIMTVSDLASLEDEIPPASEDYPESSEILQSDQLNQNEQENNTIDITPLKISEKTGDDTNNNQENDSAIPHFDLAEQILKEQRQVASHRRQRPARAKNLNVAPIAGTVGKIIEEAKKTAASAAQPPKPDNHNNLKPQTESQPAPVETADEISPYPQKASNETAEPPRPETPLSSAACQVINESDRLNPFQEDIIVDIVSKDIAKLCGDLN